MCEIEKKAMNKAIRKHKDNVRSKKETIEFLAKIGILDKKGNFSKKYSRLAEFNGETAK